MSVKEFIEKYLGEEKFVYVKKQPDYDKMLKSPLDDFKEQYQKWLNELYSMGYTPEDIESTAERVDDYNYRIHFKVKKIKRRRNEKLS